MKLLRTVYLFTVLALGLARADDAPPVETVITSSKFEGWTTTEETNSIFSGNVVVIGTNLKITCDRLVIVAVNGENLRAKVADKDQQIQKFKSLLATGKVRIIQGDLVTGREAHCERAEILPREDKITLTGEPVVIDHNMHCTAIGDTLILKKGQSHIEGDNVKLTFPAIKDLGYDKNKVSPPPAAPEPAKEPAAK